MRQCLLILWLPIRRKVVYGIQKVYWVDRLFRLSGERSVIWKVLPARRYASAVLAVHGCLSVCVRVCVCQNQVSHRNGWTNRGGFDMETFYHPSYTLLQKFSYLHGTGTSVWNYVPNSGLIENVSMTRWSSQSVVNLARQRWTLSVISYRLSFSSKVIDRTHTQLTDRCIWTTRPCNYHFRTTIRQPMDRWPMPVSEGPYTLYSRFYNRLYNRL